MNLINKIKKEGISLKIAHIVMILVTIIIMCLLIFYTIRTFSLYEMVSESADNYISLQNSAESLMNASDFLTDRVQRFTVITDIADMDSYFDEAHNVRRRENAVDNMSQTAADIEAYRQLKNSLDSSIRLMDTEMTAMKLICSACGYDIKYDEVSNAAIPPECEKMTAEEKISFARELVHNDSYYEQKTNIRNGMDNCINILTEDTSRIQSEANDKILASLTITSILFITESAAMIIMLWMTSYLGINPIIKGVQRIKENHKLPVVGSYEFRYLAKTYNKMYDIFQRSIEHLNYDASHDKLTDLYNRAGYDLIKESLHLKSTAIIMVDADKFKEINDTYGHAVGDEILKKLAEVLKYTFRREDYICRIGGDEFVIFMLHIDEDRRKLIEIKIEHINKILNDTSDELPPISVSVGVTFGSYEDDLESALKHADEALYDMKTAGRNGCAFYNRTKQNKDAKEGA